jgi:hypothetical protein
MKSTGRSTCAWRPPGRSSGDVSRKWVKTAAGILSLLLLVLFGLLAPGCASPNANPPRPRANTGYVDFHADSTNDLSWDVARFDENTQVFQKVFSDLTPPPGGILRLAFAPGRQRLQITFLNRVISQPAEIEVEVQDGKITPVNVTLTAAGTALVDRKTKSLGGTAQGQYGVRTKIRSNETVMYGVTAAADPPVTYQIKEQMPYAR